MQPMSRASPMPSTAGNVQTAGMLPHGVPGPSHLSGRPSNPGQHLKQQHRSRHIKALANKVKRVPQPFQPSEPSEPQRQQQHEQFDEQLNEWPQAPQNGQHQQQHGKAEDAPTAGSLDVSGLLINPVFRSTPWDAEREQQSSDRVKARIAFVGESNVCRSVLAQTIFGNLLEAEPQLRDLLEFDSKATRDYNIGEGPEASVLAAAHELGLVLPEGITARLFDHERDIVAYDLVLVMDKFTAADVMREVSSYDLVNKAGNYTLKVRRLGDFHPVLGQTHEPDGQDINDPLYGNMGGDIEKDAVKESAALITECCQGLLQFLTEVADEAAGTAAAAAVSGTNGAAHKQGSSFRRLLTERIKNMDTIAWLVPPMLQGRH